MIKAFWMASGFALTALGIVGLMLPVMPGTIFLILAAACFARSSPRFENWLLNHPRLGPGIRAWRRTGSIAPRIKALAVGMMATSLGAMAIVGVSGTILFASFVPMALAALYILTRP